MNRRIRIGSITYAQKGRRALSRKGIRARIVKLENATEGGGCVYGIEVPWERSFEAERELELLGIGYRFADP